MIQEIIDKIEKEIKIRQGMPHPYEQVDICYGLNRAKELVASVSERGWIEVEERSPEDGQAVLVSNGQYAYLVEYDADWDALNDLDDFY